MHYFSRITFDTRHTDAARLAETFCDNAYREHQELWRLFELDPDADRDFLYRRELLPDALQYFVVSQREPVVPNNSWRIETKPYHPKLTSGQKLAFQIRVNPVVTKKNTDGKSRRHDVVMDRKMEIGYQELAGTERPPMAEIIQQTAEGWLQKRAENHGFTVEPKAIRAEAYQQQLASKKGGKTPIRYSTLDITGVLTVADTQLFNSSLLYGLGPAKAFGCGLLLVRQI